MAVFRSALPQRLGLLLLVAFVLVFSPGCGQDEPVIEVDLTRREEVALREKNHVITYAYLPQYSHTVSYQRHRLLVRYLSEATGLNIQQIFPGTFDEHVAMVGQGKIDISFSNPSIYVKISNLYGANAFARIVEKGGRLNFRGQIICRADSDIRTLKDCRGKRWIAVDPGSAGGFLFALGHFAAYGMAPGDFAEIAFAPGPGGKQEKVVLAVLAGKYDVGSIREGTIEIMGDKVDPEQIRIIDVTPWYPGWVYAAGQGLSPEVTEKIARAMFALDPQNPEHALILEEAGLERIVEAHDHDYEPVRQLVRRLEDYMEF